MRLISNFIFIGFVLLFLFVINYIYIIKSWRRFMNEHIQRNLMYQMKHEASKEEAFDDENDQG